MQFLNFDNRKKDLVRDKKDILFLRYIILGLILTFTHTVFDYYFGNTYASLVDAGAFLLLLAIYLLAYLGNLYLLAKILFLSFVNLLLFVLASVVPKEEGIYFIFFPLVTTLFTILDAKHDKISYIFACISLILVVILEITNYKPLGDISLMDEAADHSFIVNLIASLLVVVFSVNFLVKINKKAEDHLKTNQNSLRKLSSEIQEQNEVLAKTNSELDRFVYSTSHDLRSPLMSILGLLHLAEKDEAKNQPVYLERIKIQVKKLDDFIKDIISYSRNTRVEIKNENIDFHSLVEGIISDLQFMDGADQVEFKKSIEPGENLINSDKSRLSVILNNLIANAIKYHDYEKASPFVEIKMTRTESVMIISITDNGRGIPQKYQEEVFKMFFRASENSQGSGLGLYIVKEMVEKLNGHLSLQSTEEEGSTFTIKLPISS